MRVLLLGIVAAAAAALAVVLAHAGEERYYVPWWGVAIVVVGFASAVAGASLLWRSTQIGGALAVAAATALGVTAVLAILSIGVFLLVAAVPFVLLAIERGPGGRAAAGGVLLGAALPVLVIVALDDPLVDCESGRSGESLFLALGSNEVQSSTTMSADGDSEGSMRGDGYAYEYSCRDGRLTRFELTTD